MYSIRVCGIPCQAEVYDHIKVSPWKGSANTCPSSADYYGYEDFEYNLYDTKGYRAKWLDKKVTKEVDVLIREQIFEAMSKEKQDDY